MVHFKFFPDDTCRVEECGNDDEDCTEQNMCLDDGACHIFWTVWSFMSEGEDRLNTSTCDTQWSIVMNALGLNPLEECEYYLTEYDYNGDGFLNYRESLPFSYVWYLGTENSEKYEPDYKGPNINCSSCSGMDVYNI